MPAAAGDAETHLQQGLLGSSVEGDPLLPATWHCPGRGRHQLLFMVCTESGWCRLQPGSMAPCPGSTSSLPKTPVQGAGEGWGPPRLCHWSWGTSASSAGDRQVGAAERSQVGLAGEGELTDAARILFSPPSAADLGEGASASVFPCAKHPVSLRGTPLRQRRAGELTAQRAELLGCSGVREGRDPRAAAPQPRSSPERERFLLLHSQRWKNSQRWGSAPQCLPPPEDNKLLLASNMFVNRCSCDS